MSFRLTLGAILVALAAAPLTFAQQTYVSRYDVYAGYAFLNSPAIGLFSNGVQMQIGIRQRTWYSLGFDYSNTRGDLKLTPDLLPDALRQSLQTQLAGLAAAGRLPAGYTLSVPASSVTHTFAAGPQLAYRHFRHVTLFLRPSFGAIKETAVPKPKDAIATAIVQQLAPSNKKRDWQGFYGFGYGFDVLLSRNFAIRVQGDLVWDHLFNDLLKNGRWTTRFSVGPCFNFGRNIVE
jgi:hypothetical protein